MADVQIILDLSRLLSRAMHPTPTGVDRCEMAYARGLLAAVPDRLHFAAVHPIGASGRLPRAAVLRFLDATEDRWQSRGAEPAWHSRLFAGRALTALIPRPGTTHRPPDARSAYVQASPNNLTRPAIVRAIKRRERARFVCLVHDLIPLEYPEYARPDGNRLHAQRMETVANEADGILTNSAATMRSLAPWLARSKRRPLTATAHLGTHVKPRPPSPRRQASPPYFVCIGTIEPRKNHLLLLNLWRRMAETRPRAAVPRLVLVGRRGWENEQVVDMLERCPALRHCVEERGRLADAEVDELLAGAAGLLLPAFAEGYGMPVTEAITLGVPVLCSDLPALREAGGDVPCYLDPLDGPGWQRAIDDLSAPGSQIRAAQDRARPAWNSPTWDEHVATLLDMIDQLTPG